MSLILCLQCSYVEPCEHESSIYAELMCPFDHKFAKTTVFTLSIRTPQLLTIYVLKFEPVQFPTRCCV